MTTAFDRGTNTLYMHTHIQMQALRPIYVELSRVSSKSSGQIPLKKQDSFFPSSGDHSSMFTNSFEVICGSR